MELVQELLMTALVAVLFSFLIAKLVSMAMSCDSSSHDPHSKNVDQQEVTAGDDVVADENEEKIIMEDLQFRERLEVEGFKSQTKAEFVEQLTQKVEEFVSESAPVDEEIIPSNREELIETESRDSAQESVDIVSEEVEEDKLKGGEFEVKELNFPKENRQEEPIGIELGVDEEIGVVESDSKIEERKMEIDVVDDEDDWEGIERSELEKKFAEAAKFVVESGDKDERLGKAGSDVQMELYGLHKVATEGPCREQPPMALKVSARAKWNAWQSLGNMNPEVAMEQYIALVSDRAPEWMEGKTHEEDKPGSSEVANPACVTPPLSTFSSHQPNFTDETNPEPNFGAEESSDLTGGSNLENRAKE